MRKIRLQQQRKSTYQWHTRGYDILTPLRADSEDAPDRTCGCLFQGGSKPDFGRRWRRSIVNKLRRRGGRLLCQSGSSPTNSDAMLYSLIHLHMSAISSIFVLFYTISRAPGLPRCHQPHHRSHVHNLRPALRG